jgi:hypothetical protein
VQRHRDGILWTFQDDDAVVAAVVSTTGAKSSTTTAGGRMGGRVYVRGSIGSVEYLALAENIHLQRRDWVEKRKKNGSL